MLDLGCVGWLVGWVVCWFLRGGFVLWLTVDWLGFGICGFCALCFGYFWFAFD